MKIEFNSRVELQRSVLKIVNKRVQTHQLSGLSKLSIDSWVVNNRIFDNQIKETLYNISEKLFFIANRSQDQITEEYQQLQSNIKLEIDSLGKMLE